MHAHLENMHKHLAMRTNLKMEQCSRICTHHLFGRTGVEQYVPHLQTKHDTNNTHTLISQFPAWYRHFNKMWRGYNNYMGQISPRNEIMQHASVF